MSAQSQPIETISDTMHCPYAAPTIYSRKAYKRAGTCPSISRFNDFKSQWTS